MNDPHSDALVFFGATGDLASLLLTSTLMHSVRVG
jgi:glucose-6-phosphate 1-dehydrogenase